MISIAILYTIGLWFLNLVSRILFFGACSLLKHLSRPLFPVENLYIYKKSSNQQGPTV